MAIFPDTKTGLGPGATDLLPSPWLIRSIGPCTSQPAAGPEWRQGRCGRRHLSGAAACCASPALLRAVFLLANFSAVEKGRLHCLCPCPCVFIRSTPLSCGAIAGFFHGRLSCRCAIRLVLQSSPSQPRVCLGQNLQPWLWPVLYQKGCCLAGPSAPFFEAALSCFPGAGFWKDPMATLCCLVAKAAATAACIQPDRWHMVDLFGCKSLYYKMPGTNFSLLFFCLKHKDRSRTCSIFCLQKMQTVAG